MLFVSPFNNVVVLNNWHSASAATKAGFLSKLPCNRFWNVSGHSADQGGRKRRAGLARFFRAVRKCSQ
jgi:hypothetical protein